MPTEPFKIYPRYKEIVDGYFTRIKNARKEGKFIGWGVVMLPSEMLRAIDIEPVMGEPFSAVCAASGLSLELTAATENYGLGRDFCAYSRNFIGAYLLNKSPLGDMPAPDLVLGFRTGCNDHIAWFETLSRITGKPFFSLDIPMVYGDVQEYHIAYVQAQLENLIRFLEEVTRRKVREERLVEAVILSHKTMELWTQILAHCQHIPSPLSFRNQLSFMVPAVSQRGTRAAVDFYQALLSEVEDRVKRGITAAAEEKVRLLWDNVPMWYYTQLFGYLDQKGAVIVVSPYVALFGAAPPVSPSLSERGKGLLRWEQPNNLREALRERAKDYLRHMTFENLPAKLACYEQVVKDYHVGAALYHANRGCKNLSLNKLDTARYLEDKLHIPVLVFEGSNADPKDFNEKEVVPRIEAFLQRIAAI